MILLPRYSFYHLILVGTAPNTVLRSWSLGDFHYDIFMRSLNRSPIQIDYYGFLISLSSADYYYLTFLPQDIWLTLVDRFQWRLVNNQQSHTFSFVRILVGSCKNFYPFVTGILISQLVKNYGLQFVPYSCCTMQNLKIDSNERVVKNYSFRFVLNSWCVMQKPDLFATKFLSNPSSQIPMRGWSIINNRSFKFVSYFRWVR